jgi:hypothetical protein
MNSALIHIGKIKSPEILRDALKHNLRLIEREVEIESHISPDRKGLNIVLAGESDPLKITSDTVELVKQSTGKRKLRSNGVFAVEVIVSLPVNIAIDTNAFFEQTLEWLRDYYACPVLSAVIHHDEANPHMHVLVLPLRDGRMAGARVAGYKPDWAAMKKNHHIEVGSQFGLVHVEAVPRFKRFAAAKKIVACLQEHPSWVSHPSIEAALLSAIICRPAELLSVLGIDPEFG